jgi:hypothetical protein
MAIVQKMFNGMIWKCECGNWNSSFENKCQECGLDTSKTKCPNCDQLVEEEVDGTCPDCDYDLLLGMGGGE